jgi:hypothetical protein
MAYRLHRSFNRDPESAAMGNLSTCNPRCWQSTAGSAFAWRRSAWCASKRAPRRVGCGNPQAEGNVCGGNLTLGRG